jgi:hypothetical protein
MRQAGRIRGHAPTLGAVHRIPQLVFPRPAQTQAASRSKVRPRRGPIRPAARGSARVCGACPGEVLRLRPAGPGRRLPEPVRAAR